MPYKITKKGDKWCVQKKDGSKTFGCHDSEEKAKKQMAAIHANENKSIAQFSMAITKASIPNKGDRTMRIRMVNSDTGEDAYEERMSVELFNDFVERIEDNTPIPEPFDVIVEDGWNGGMPYLSISHYKSGAGKNVPGEPEKVYVDGERLKSSAILHENPLGLAVWKSINTDLEERSKPIEERTYKDPVRISIGFLDLEHKHEIEGEDDYIFTRSELGQKCPKCEEGINGKVYLKGQLVHLAFTRVPANPRTQVEVLRMSDEIETKRDDAESIIGDLADELVGKSVIEDDTLVVKAEKDYRQYANKVEHAFAKEFAPPPRPSLYVRSVTDKNVIVVEYTPSDDYMESSKVYKIGYKEEDGNFTFDKRSDWVEMEFGLMPKKSEAKEYEWEVKFEERKLEEEMEKDNQVVEPVEEEVVEEPVVEEEVVEEVPVKSTIEQATDNFKAKVLELKSKGITGEKAIEVLQPLFNEMGKVVKDEVNPPKALTVEDVAEVVKSVVPEIVAQVLKALPEQNVQKKADEIPAPRSILVNRAVTPQGQNEMTQIQKIALQSTGQ